MRLSVVVVAICICVIGISSAADVEAAIRKQTNIPAQGLGPALQDLAKDRNLQVVYRSEVIGKLRTRGAVGEFTADEALTQLLSGTGLTFHYLADNAITIVPIVADQPGGGPISAAPAQEKTPPTGANDTDPIRGDETRTLRDRLHLAQVDSGSPSGAVSVGNANSSSQDSAKGSGGLSEIIVTAQKKSERLQDVPIPVTVLNANTLADNGQVLLRDYYASVPGLSLTPNFEATQILAIRGITTGDFGNPTVGVMVDDVPYGTSNEVPDIDPGDLARIEVLRGPQGTLYGANSMGGLLKYVTVDPSTESLSGRVEAGTNYVHSGAEPGYNLRASANIPLSDSLAIRVSAFNRQDPGYIDNPVLHMDGVNEAESYGGRLAALWRPAEEFSLKLSALYQNTTANGSSEVVKLPTLGDLEQNYIPDSGGYERTVEVYSARLNAKLGSVDLTSITGYNIDRHSDTLDYTFALGSFSNKHFGVTGTALNTDYEIDKFSEEVRLSIPLGQRLEWLVGGFYTHENPRSSQQTVVAENPSTGQIVGQEGAIYNEGGPFEEYAAFTDLTYHVTDRFDIQIGGRDSEIRQTFNAQTETGLLFGDQVVPGSQSTANAFTYLVTPRFRVSSDLMVYARLASGYRPGGSNGAAAVSQGAPSEFDPDKTQNYEIGVKADLLDHTLSIDTSLYYIQWKDIQIQLFTPQNFTYSGNGSGAKSEGVELSVTSRPLTGLAISGWVTYDDAALTQAFVNSPTYGVPGDRLPLSSRFSGNVSLQQDFALPVWSGATGFVGAQASYVGDRFGTFQDTPLRQHFPSYTKIDLRAGVKVDSWTANFYVNNVADSRGVLDGGIGYLNPSAFIYIQPRTAGLNLSRTF
jgi:iron complex outermembrane receptor protein